MFHRLLSISSTQSCFLFGARATGKSTFLQSQLNRPLHFINLLESGPYQRYGNQPDLLINDVTKLSKSESFIVIDEIQKLPQLLDVVHHLIESKKIKFILTGSSARKLKRGSANLLAGRAFQYFMHPLTSIELGDAFDLNQTLMFGSIPKVIALSNDDKIEFLRSYSNTYLKEEILEEQLVRNTFAFRNFLEVAAQENGNTLNFTKIAKDLNIDYKTAQTFFQILEDTLVGFFLPAYHKSTRKSVKHQPKFYLFDLGIKRALEHSLQQPLNVSTSAYGKAFEHFIICEIFRLNSYYKLDFSMSHYQTSAGGEVDLILHRANEVIAIEIKSSTMIEKDKVRKFSKASEPLKPNRKIYISQDEHSSLHENVECFHWLDFLHNLKSY